MLATTVTVFDRIVCGIDESAASLEALRQAERMLAPGGQLHLLSAADLTPAVHAGWAASHVFDEIQIGAKDALARATEHVRAAGSRLVDGDPARCLREEINRVGGTLIALGSHGHGRAAGIWIGGTASALLHDAPCSVLLARRPLHHEAFPSSIVVGVDGSSESLRALEAAVELGQRLRIGVRRVAATGGKPVDTEGLSAVTDLEWDARKPLNALLAAAEDAHLVVVGNRGLHGLAALGSVSERVAHRARSSVLVVRV
jgi:nucleotide-binding universal stress UspA family protein